MLQVGLDCPLVAVLGGVFMKALQAPWNRRNLRDWHFPKCVARRLAGHPFGLHLVRPLWEVCSPVQPGLEKSWRPLTARQYSDHEL